MNAWVGSAVGAVKAWVGSAVGPVKVWVGSLAGAVKACVGSAPAGALGIGWVASPGAGSPSGRRRGTAGCRV